MDNQDLSPQQVKALLDDNKIVLIDVREPQEYMGERIAGALLFPLSTFDPAKLPKAEALVFHCGIGKRSAMALQKCRDAGLINTQHMAGGFSAWKSAGLPYLQLDPRSGQVCSIC